MKDELQSKIHIGVIGGFKKPKTHLSEERLLEYKGVRICKINKQKLIDGLQLEYKYSGTKYSCNDFNTLLTVNQVSKEGLKDILVLILSHENEELKKKIEVKQPLFLFLKNKNKKCFAFYRERKIV